MALVRVLVPRVGTSSARARRAALVRTEGPIVQSHILGWSGAYEKTTETLFPAAKQQRARNQNQFGGSHTAT